MGTFRLTKREKSWILYDVGNSAFTMLVSTLIPIYFNALAENAGISDINYLAYWGYAGSIATLLTAIIGPVFGTLADRKNYKKPIFLIALILGAISCALLGFAWSWLAFLIIFVLAKVSYSSSLVFYDAMLPENSGAFRVEFEDGKALSVQPTTDAPDAELPIGAFSAALMGCLPVEQMVWRPDVAVHCPEAVAPVFYRKPNWICNHF